MNSILYVGMDVHKENYTLCCYSFDRDTVEYRQTVPSDYRLILKYLEQVRRKYPEEVEFICGYEAGCLGYSLYHQLTDHGVKYSVPVSRRRSCPRPRFCEAASWSGILEFPRADAL